jgi:hypothetical protein
MSSFINSFPIDVWLFAVIALLIAALTLAAAYIRVPTQQGLYFDI